MNLHYWTQATLPTYFCSNLSPYPPSDKLPMATAAEVREGMPSTNEFDPARLKRACERLASNSHMFRHVVHINTDALRATYGDHPEATMREY